MKTRLLMLWLLFGFAGCGVGQRHDLLPLGDAGVLGGDAGVGSAFDGGFVGSTLELLVQPQAQVVPYVVGQLDAGLVRFDDVLTYAWADGYPKQLRLIGDAAALVAQCPVSRQGSLRWSSVQALSGSSARVVIDGHELKIELLATGESRFQLRGEFVQPAELNGRCTVNGSKPDMIVMEQVLTIQVVAPVRVEFFSPFSVFDVPGCDRKLLIPSGAAVALPMPRLIDANERPIYAGIGELQYRLRDSDSTDRAASDRSDFN